ncbi:hypothetical protein C8P63_12280 [Melghirimyces profundicolus]|uniref:Uncharacterized protein n=1 Tax=Melghirimyces profundicolus TaxID=1242148 RepID=A0A2T6BGE1_9BACL|nr:hypothetical protein C8P63_12280 [Melghirimyces profundicolus]
MAFPNGSFFGGEGIISDNDPEEQEKMIKYNGVPPTIYKKCTQGKYLLLAYGVSKP